MVINIDVSDKFQGLNADIIFSPPVIEYKVHSYNKNGLCALAFMDDHYPVRSAFSLLNKVLCIFVPFVIFVMVILPDTGDFISFKLFY